MDRKVEDTERGDCYHPRSAQKWLVRALMQNWATSLKSGRRNRDSPKPQISKNREAGVERWRLTSVYKPFIGSWKIALSKNGVAGDGMLKFPG
jgi:hypothetical protein